MGALQGMDMNNFIIIAPTALIAMYVLITAQKRLSNSKNVHLGLIIPGICFVAATVLAFRPLFILNGSGADGLVVASLTVWMTFNIPTLAFLFPYFMGLKNRKANQMIADAMAAEENAAIENDQVVEDTAK